MNTSQTSVNIYSQLNYNSFGPTVTLFSPFPLFLAAGSSFSLLLLCTGFVVICNINKKKYTKTDNVHKAEPDTAGVIHREVKLKRSETEKEFQQTKIRTSEKHSEKFVDRQHPNIERKFHCQCPDNENNFQKLYNHSFRTFGQKRRPSYQPAEHRFLQQALEYQEKGISEHL